MFDQRARVEESASERQTSSLKETANTAIVVDLSRRLNGLILGLKICILYYVVTTSSNML